MFSFEKVEGFSLENKMVIIILSRLYGYLHDDNLLFTPALFTTPIVNEKYDNLTDKLFRFPFNSIFKRSLSALGKLLYGPEIISPEGNSIIMHTSVKIVFSFESITISHLSSVLILRILYVNCECASLWPDFF